MYSDSEDSNSSAVCEVMLNVCQQGETYTAVQEVQGKEQTGERPSGNPKGKKEKSMEIQNVEDVKKYSTKAQKSAPLRIQNATSVKRWVIENGNVTAKYLQK